MEIVTPEAGLRQYEVDRTSFVKGLLGNKKSFRMRLRVTEDERDAADGGSLAIRFEMLESDLLSRFSGNWELIPKRDHFGDIVACEGRLRQDILPEGESRTKHC